MKIPKKKKKKKKRRNKMSSIPNPKYITTHHIGRRINRTEIIIFKRFSFYNRSKNLIKINIKKGKWNSGIIIWRRLRLNYVRISWKRVIASFTIIVHLPMASMSLDPKLTYMRNIKPCPVKRFMLKGYANMAYAANISMRN
jgi:hypothetical protein